MPDTSESKELFFTLSKEQRVAIREKLLESLGSESLAHVRNKIGDAVAEIAGQYADNGMFFLSRIDCELRELSS